MGKPVAAAFGFAVTALAFDLVTGIAATFLWCTFGAAPNDAYRVPADDSDFFLAGLGFAGVSLLWYALLVVLIVLLLVCRRRAWLIAAIALMLTEIVYVALQWDGDGPDGAWFALRIASIVVSAGVSATLVLSLARGLQQSRRSLPSF